MGFEFGALGALWDEAQPGGGDTYAGEEGASTEQRQGLAKIRAMLSTDAYNPNISGPGYYSKEFDFWGGKGNQWRDQLMGAAQTSANPILRAVSEQVEADFARRGLTTTGAAGAAKARALMDVAAKIAFPIEQQVVQTEKEGVQGKYGLQQYALGLALGPAGTIGQPVQAPERETFLGGLMASGAQGLGQGLGMAATGGLGGITSAASSAAPLTQTFNDGGAGYLSRGSSFKFGR